MKYKSSNGTLFFYDRVLYRWNYADPTMLFLLGFEAITTCYISLSDSLTISKNVYLKYSNEVEPLNNFNIFEDIYAYLSKLGRIDDLDYYLKYHCAGLKLLLNDITGTNDDRTVPIIFHTDINHQEINLNNQMYRLPESDRYSKSMMDLQTQKISDIFEDAEYNLSKGIISSSQILTKDIREHLTSDEIKQINQDISTYNNDVYQIYTERFSNSEIYRQLDYQSMYSYALGVLYGCMCLGYDLGAIIRFEPQYWYNGKYTNLVTTAWVVLRFHWTTYLKYIKTYNDKYTSIVENKLWNFTNDYKDITPLAEDETIMYAFNKGVENPVIESVVYSQRTTPSVGENHSHTGSYLVLNSTSSYYNQWASVDDFCTDNPKRGIISLHDNVIERYIGNNLLSIRKAYHIQKDAPTDEESTEYLSPNDTDLYFIATDNIGWVALDENYIVDVEPPEYKRVNTLSLVPHNLPSDVTLQYAYDIEDSSIITYYTCCISPAKENPHTDATYLYGVFDKYIIPGQDPIPEEFDFVLSEDDIDKADSKYSTTNMPEGYSQQLLYDLSNQIYLMIKHNDITDEDEIWGGPGDPPPSNIPLTTTGYTSTPSYLLDIYNSSNEFQTIRHNNTINQYWSTESYENGSWSARTWHDSLPNNLYIKTTDVTKLYKGEVRLDRNIVLYNRTNTLLPQYIYNDESHPISGIPSDLGYGFISLNNDSNSLLSHGITTNICYYILEDDDGNPLTDEQGNPLVWYDPVDDKYWNGLFGLNVWQSEKPHLVNKLMYDSSENLIKGVFEDELNHMIRIENGEYMTYTEFYANDQYGVIRETLQVFNPSITNEGIIECYHDNYSIEYDRYIIPGKTNQWVSRTEISTAGYRFVDGTSTLWNGDQEETVVVDDHPED
jgi:hypothetical protein